MFGCLKNSSFHGKLFHRLNDLRKEEVYPKSQRKWRQQLKATSCSVCHGTCHATISKMAGTMYFGWDSLIKWNIDSLNLQGKRKLVWETGSSTNWGKNLQCSVYSVLEKEKGTTVRESRFSLHITRIVICLVLRVFLISRLRSIQTCSCQKVRCNMFCLAWSCTQFRQVYICGYFKNMRVSNEKLCFINKHFENLHKN